MKIFFIHFWKSRGVMFQIRTRVKWLDNNFYCIVFTILQYISVPHNVIERNLIKHVIIAWRWKMIISRIWPLNTTRLWRLKRIKSGWTRWSWYKKNKMVITIKKLIKFCFLNYLGPPGKPATPGSSGGGLNIIPPPTPPPKGSKSPLPTSRKGSMGL